MFVIIIVLSVIAAYSVSRRITLPIRNILLALKDMEGQDIDSARPLSVPSYLNELEELQQSFMHMRGKLVESVHNTLEAKEHEYRAILQSLQSQMDPHFIYNILSIIGIMAEDKNTSGITETIGHLSHLLRYASSAVSPEVCIKDEIEYTTKYLLCMKVRFQDSLEYSLAVPEALHPIKIPKLILQPLVENCLKYGIEKEPPWHISIRGETDGKGWQLVIEDDGPGFSPEFLAAFERKAKESNGTYPERSLEINGMGLLNIYFRLRLFYHGESIFRLGNRPEGGASVVIGGKV
jgi:sensor histidine kinase YesM